MVQAYRRGLERRLAGGLSLDLTSFASVFMSRYDAPVDDVHIGRIRASSSPEEIATLKSVVGRVSIANAWMVVRRFREFFDGPDFAPLSAAGARTQRPLWAGVVARNGRYGDVTYMGVLAIPGTAITASDPPVDGTGSMGPHCRPRTTGLPISSSRPSGGWGLTFPRSLSKWKKPSSLLSLMLSNDWSRAWPARRCAALRERSSEGRAMYFPDTL